MKGILIFCLSLLFAGVAISQPAISGTTKWQASDGNNIFPIDADDVKGYVSGFTVISPAQITTNQNDYEPTGWATADLVRISFDSDGNMITGFATWTGAPKKIVNVGTNYGVICANHPLSDSENQVVGAMDYILPPGGTVTIYPDATTAKLRVLDETFDFTQVGARWKGQYFNVSTPSETEADNTHIKFTTSGTGAAISTKAPAAGLQRGLSIATGTTSTGAAAVSIPKAGEGFAWGTGHKIFWATIYIPTLSTSGQRFSADCALSLINGTSAALPDRSSAGIRYSDNLNSGKWQLYTYDVSQVQATADSGITVAANTLYLLCVIVDQAVSEARYFINGAYVGRITSNLPSTAQNANGRAVIVKSVGTTSTEIVLQNIGYANITN